MKIKRFSRRIVLIYSIIIVMYGLSLYPIVGAFTELWQSRTVMLYYSLLGGGESSGEAVKPSDFCKAPLVFPKSPTLEGTIRTTLHYSLLPNFTLALSTQALQKELIRIQSLHLSKPRLVIDFSKEFYTLTGNEEIAFVYRLLLNIEENFSNIEEVYITIDGHAPMFVNSSIYYGEPLNLATLSETLFTTQIVAFPPCPTY